MEMVEVYHFNLVSSLGLCPLNYQGLSSVFGIVKEHKNVGGGTEPFSIARDEQR